MSRVIIFGGDGFCGWPTALYLSSNGYDVTIVDNLDRRKIDVELECDSLTPIQPINKRLETWKNITGRDIDFHYIDLSKHYRRILDLIKEKKPKAIIHFAEQRAAPYSMKSFFHRRFTIHNNVNTTNNILSAITESGLDIHTVHLGTTGYYGYSTVNMEIPEGYLPVTVNADGEEKELEIMYPPDPGSIYHLTKCYDAMSFYYYNKNDKLKITDLHQGIVWGTQTNETRLHEDLINRFDYDGDFGTVLNRFLVESQVGHPLTIHGTGGQTRAFIHISDTVKCIKLAIENPPKKGDRVKILNQTTECLRVRDLAYKINEKTGAEVRFYKNPRNEDNENELRFNKDTFLKELGLNPTTLDDGILDEIIEIVNEYKYRCDLSKIVCTSTWTNDIEPDLQGSNQLLE